MKYGLLLFQRSQLGKDIHPFVLSEVEAFCRRFDKVFLVCFSFDQDIDTLDVYKNLEIRKISITKAKHFSGCILSFFRSFGVEDARVAIKNKVFNFSYLKKTAEVVLFGRALANEACKVIESYNTEGDEWTIEGYWLTGPAYAAAYLKEKYPFCFSFARAHSSEIDYIRNPQSICQLKKYIYENLDAVFFVADWGKKNFCDFIMPLHRIKANERVFTVRLGVNKQYESVNVGSSDEVFRLVTCSRVVPLKRLDLLAEALQSIHLSKTIEWTLIGDGPELEKIKEICNNCSENIKIIFKGALPNGLVHRYLSETPVDLFINLSAYEGLPVSVMEAMAYGIPVLATDVGGTAEIVNDSNGMLLPSNITIDTVQEAIEYFVNLDNKQKIELRYNAYNTWKKHYDKDENYDDMFELIDRIKDEY